MTQFYGLYTVKDQPSLPTAKKVSNGTFITFWAYTRLVRPASVMKNGERTYQNFSSEKFSLFVNFDKQGNESKLVPIITTPGVQLMLQGTTYEAKGEDKYYRRFDVQNFQLVKRSTNEGNSNNPSQDTKPHTDEPIVSQVNTAAVDDSVEDIPF